MSHPIEEPPRDDVAAHDAAHPSEPAGETSLLRESAGETSLLRVLWYPMLLFIAGPAIVTLAVKLLLGI